MMFVKLDYFKYEGEGEYIKTFTYRISGESLIREKIFDCTTNCDENGDMLLETSFVREFLRWHELAAKDGKLYHPNGKLGQDIIINQKAYVADDNSNLLI